MSPYNTFSIYIWPWGTVQRYVIVVHTYVAQKYKGNSYMPLYHSKVIQKIHTGQVNGWWLLTPVHTRTHTHTNTVSCMHNCVYTHTCALRHFWGRRRALSGSHNRNIQKWRACLLIAANPSPRQNTLPCVSPLFPFSLSPTLRPLSRPSGHHTQALSCSRVILISSSN